MVPTERLELSRLSPPPPQDGVSTNSTTSAYQSQRKMQSDELNAKSSALTAHYLGTSPAFDPLSDGAAGAACPAGALGTGTSDGTDLAGAGVAITPL